MSVLSVEYIGHCGSREEHLWPIALFQIDIMSLTKAHALIRVVLWIFSRVDIILQSDMRVVHNNRT